MLQSMVSKRIGHEWLNNNIFLELSSLPENVQDVRKTIYPTLKWNIPGSGDLDQCVVFLFVLSSMAVVPVFVFF